MSRFKYDVGDTVEGAAGGNVYTLVERKGKKGYFSCSICSSDVELYPALFPALSSQIFLKQRMICGCSPSGYRHNEKQLEVIAKRSCEKYNETYIGLGKFSGYRTKMKRVCENGHQTEVRLEDYKKRKVLCPMCTQTFKKVLAGRDRDKDYLYIARFTNKSNESTFIKVGRTLNVNQRLTNLKNQHHNKYHITLLHLWSGDHTKIVEVEFDIHYDNRLKGHSMVGVEDSPIKTEIYTDDALVYAVSFIEERELEEEYLKWSK